MGMHGIHTSDNPILSREYRIPFSRIRPAHVVPAVRHVLERAERGIAELVERAGERTYGNTVERLDELVERVGRVVGIVRHLVAVRDSPELREAYEEVNPEVAEFYAKITADEGVWSALRAVAESPESARLSPIRKRHLEKLLRSFARAGAGLPPEERPKVVSLKVELARLSKRFAENVLDANKAYELVLTDPAELAGLPESAVARAKESAEAKRIEGWRFTLDAPSYVSFIEHADRRELRRAMWTAYHSRSTAEGRDNRPLVRQILARRRELARALGYRDFADYQLEERMAKTGASARAFLRDLTERTRPHFLRDIAALERFAAEELGYERLEAWDVAYVAEKMRRARHDLDPEALRPYFALDTVLEAMFEIAGRLFGITVRGRADAETWHPDVRYFEVHDEAGSHIGSFYADFFPREDKRGGAWMDDLITGGPRPGGFAPHLAVLAANFAPPIGGKPALLTHDEVQTLFHEFGHCLHLLLSRVEIPALAGINVAWDFVELPSQILENWTWKREALDLIARHHETGEPLPEEVLERILEARTFLAAYDQMRQLAYGTVDLELHTTFDPSGSDDPLALGAAILRECAVRPEAVDGNDLASFTHVFSGGYGAGYYSYKWAELLDADAFSRFEREGLFNPRTGRDLAEAILSRGDGAEPLELFRAFMGRGPDPDALLRRVLPTAAALNP